MILQSTARATASLAALLCSSMALAVQDCDIDGLPVNPANGSTTAGKSGIMRCIDRDTRVIQREQELVDGKFIGMVRYYQDGKLQKEHRVNERGNLQGRAREYAANGALLRDTTYDNGSVAGLSRQFYASGAARRAAYYGERNSELAVAEWTESGKLASLKCGSKPLLAPAADDTALCGFAGKVAQVEFFAAGGAVAARASYALGERLRYERLHGNGQVAEQEELLDNTRIERRFGSDGVKRKETLWVTGERASYKQREQDFSERGSLARDQLWRDGLAVSDIEYFLNGQPRRKTEWSGERNQRSSRVSEFHDNGGLAGERSYLIGSRGEQIATGSYKRYDERGKLRAETAFDDRGRVRRERVWTEAGQLERDDEVFADGSRKAFTQ